MLAIPSPKAKCPSEKTYVCLFVCFLTSVSRQPILSRLKELNTRTNSLHLMNIFMRLNTRLHICISSIQFSHSVISDSLRPHESQHARLPCPSPTSRVYANSRASSQWCHPVFSSSVPLLLLAPIPPSFRVSSNESTLLMRWLKYRSFSFSISPSSEHPGLISFRMDWLDLLAV